MTAAENARVFRQAALALGFHRVGFTPVGPVERHRVYVDWIGAGQHGAMDYLSRDAAPRLDARQVLEGARTVVAVALSYRHGDGPDVPADALTGGPRGVVARYARGTDYHMVLKTKLQRLAADVAASLGRPILARACVDTAPILEREAAQAAGLGFIAKNTMLIAPGLGSYVVLGELLTDVECEPDAPIAPRCGQCRACLDACPTGAFVDAYTLDARRCISYLTIELVGSIPRELRPLVGDRVFGCDICQEVCPFNAATGEPGAPELAPRAGVSRPSLRRLMGLGAAQFRKWQRQTAMRRVHRAQLLRNVAVALGNVGDLEDLPTLIKALAEPQPLVREHVVWALGAIARRHPEARSTVEAIFATHDDPDHGVRAELVLASEP